jgi:cytochrome c-type biogenesis protein CcmH/NrfG
MFFIDDILLAPINGIQFVLRTLAKVAEEQYTDDAPLKERLLELQVMLDSGDITEQQYIEEEAEIFRRLRDIEEHKRELAGAPPLAERGPLSGIVSADSKAEITFEPQGPPSEQFEDR